MWIRIVLACCWLFWAGAVGAEEAEGILYYAQGGSGAGTVHVLANGKVLRLHYTKDKLKDCAPASAWRYGSYWKINYQGASLHEIRSLEKMQKQISAADQMLRQHYRLMAQGRWAEAYGDFSSAWRKAQSMAAFQKGNSGVRYAADPPLWALKVIGHNRDEVWMLLDGAALIEGSHGYYRVIVKFEAGRPVIDRVDPITQGDFDAS